MGEQTPFRIGASLLASRRQQLLLEWSGLLGIKGGVMKVAAVQMDVTILEKQRNLEKILAWLESTARAGAGIVVFPECALTGYCYASKEEADPSLKRFLAPPQEALGGGKVARLHRRGRPARARRRPDLQCRGGGDATGNRRHFSQTPPSVSWESTGLLLRATSHFLSSRRRTGRSASISALIAASRRQAGY